MPRQKARSGRVQYLGRAFHQDAMEAMRGDIVRGIIEAVTNSDDAYASMEDGRTKRIVVEVEHRRMQQGKVIVRDRASGMCADDMEIKLTHLGGRTSGFEVGEYRRGNLGRGAKDLAAFGDVTFESICNGRYSKLLLKLDGSWELNPVDYEVSDADRDRLGILRGNGFVVTISLKPGTPCPQHENLKRKLSTHFAFRDILSDPLRKVELINLNDGSTVPVIYQYPTLPIAFEQKNIDIRGYPEAKASLIIWRHVVRYDDGPYDPGRPNGILIKGNRAIYENTLFDYEGNVHAGWFSGKVVCSFIDWLAREYDERLQKQEDPVPENPIPIITRRRDGLNPDHPFVQALKKAVEKPLGELVAKEAELARKTAGMIESTETRRALDRVAREVSNMVNEELREIEAEELPGEGEGPVPILTLIPEQAYAYMGEDRTLTVAGRRVEIPEDAEVEVSSDPIGVLDILTPRVMLRPHIRREDVLVGQVRIRPLLDGEATLVTVRYESASAAALVEVRATRTVPPIEEIVPDALQFERPSYRVGWHRQKELLLLAPANEIAKFGSRVKLNTSDSGVPVLTPVITLKPVESGKVYIARARIEARILNAKALITAQCKDTFATTHIIVTRQEESGGFRLQLLPQEWGNYRAIIEPETDEAGQQRQFIKIAGRHPAIRMYVGENFEFTDTPQARAIFADVIADVTSRYVVSKLYQKRQSTEVFDADRIYREHYKRITRFLPRLQRILIGDIGAVPGHLESIIEIKRDKVAH